MNSHILKFIFALALLPFMVQAQSSISGQIQLPNQEKAVGAHIWLMPLNLATTSNQEGEFKFSKIPQGKYTLKASFLGYKPYEIDLTLNSEQSLTLKIELEKASEELGEVTVLDQIDGLNPETGSESLRIPGKLIEIPQNIQIVGKDLLEEQQVFDMLDGIQRNVSGAQKLEHWEHYARINMRGSQITAFRNGMNMKLSNWSPLAEDMSFVERVEFVKGPAGFMMGSGQPGGFYNVVTKRPLNYNATRIQTSMGNFNSVRSAVDLNLAGEKIKGLNFRLNFMGQKKGSHRPNEFTNRYSIAPVLSYTLADGSEISLEYIEQGLTTLAIGSNYSFSSNAYADLDRSFTTAAPNLDPSKMKDQSITLGFSKSIHSNWNLRLQSSYLKYSQTGQSLWPRGLDSLGNMQRGISIWDALGLNLNAQAILRGSFTTWGLKHKILSGIDLNQREYFADWSQGAALGDTVNIYEMNYQALPLDQIPVWDRSRDIRERGVAYRNGFISVYLQDEISFLQDDLKFSFGGRFTQNNYENPYAGTTQDAEFTPRLGLNYLIRPGFSAFALYDEIFLANTGTDWQGKPFDPVRGDNKEIGLKKSFDHGITLSLSAYQITKNNVLTTDLEHPDPVSGQFIYSTQTGQQQVRGIEFDANGRINDQLSIALNYAYTLSEITKDANPEIIGNPIPGATKHIQNTWVSYRIKSGKLKGLGLNTGYQFQAGRSSWFIFDESQNPLPNYFRWDGGLSYAFEKLKVQVLAKNLLDEYLYSGAPYGNIFYWQSEPGRNFSLQFSYQF